VGRGAGRRWGGQLAGRCMGKESGCAPEECRLWGVGLGTGSQGTGCYRRHAILGNGAHALVRAYNINKIK
jgi:hypothetical protein